jgi:ribonuclease-3
VVEPVGNESLQGTIGHEFSDPSLLQLALTHSSHSRRNNERLEYLGDSLLNFLIAEELYRRFPAAREGELSRLRVQLVNGRTLALVARELELGAWLHLGGGERKSGGADRDSILADAVEALIGAILLDAGEGRCREVVIAWFESRLAGLNPAQPQKDSKTRLQEYLQGHGQALPKYQVVTVSGQAHAQQIEVACTVTGLETPCRGRGRSRRLAEQQAAGVALQRLGAEHS